MPVYPTTVALSATRYIDPANTFSLVNGLTASAYIEAVTTVLGQSQGGLEAIVRIDMDAAAGFATLSADALGRTSYFILSAQKGGQLQALFGNGLVFPATVAGTTYKSGASASVTLSFRDVLLKNTVITLSANNVGSIVATGGALDNFLELARGVGISSPRAALRTVANQRRLQSYLG